MMGWTCPGCSRGFSPAVVECPYCPGRGVTATGSTFEIHPCKHKGGLKLDANGFVCKECGASVTESFVSCVHDYEMTTSGLRCRRCGEQELVRVGAARSFGIIS